MTISLRQLFKGYYKYCDCGCLELIPIINTKGKIARFKKHHNIKGRNHPNWNGGRRFDEINGYWIIYHDLHPFKDCNNNIKEHRYKLEIYLSVLNGYPTYIHPSLEVHHKDGNKENNHWSNLQILTKTEHAQLSCKEKPKFNKIDMSGRRCSNPGCRNERITTKKRNGIPVWFGNKIDGWECNNCYSRKKYYYKRKITIL